MGYGASSAGHCDSIEETTSIDLQSEQSECIEHPLINNFEIAINGETTYEPKSPRSNFNLELRKIYNIKFFNS